MKFLNLLYKYKYEIMNALKNILDDNQFYYLIYNLKKK